MRITCPNCGAQYEVPAEVIPQDGRDVQCSNCGVTWFQGHPDAQGAGAQPVEAAVPVAVAPEEPEEEVGAEEAPEPEAAEAEAARRELDSSVTDILREEAAHEARLRQSDPLESQPDLGLDEPAPNSVAARARGRTAALRKAPAEDAVGSRRDLLPDIEEINSTLRADNGKPVARRAEVEEDDYEDEAPKRSGFSRGFATVMILAVLLVLLYANAPMLSQKVPALDAFINGFVGMVDRARLWLDSQVKSFSG